MTASDIELAYIFVHLNLYFVSMESPYAWVLHALAFVGYLIAHHV